MKLLHLTLIAALGAVATLSGCSSEADSSASPVPVDGNQIRFAAQSGTLSRSVTTTASLSEFAVYAYTDGTVLMNDVTVRKNTDNTWTYSPAQYWPAAPVNFYAFAPTLWGDDGQPTTVNPTEPIDYYNHFGNVDLLYSVNHGAVQTNGPVVFNFRHALSQVLVSLRTDSASVYDIRVYAVNVEGVKTSGTFTFPMATTTAGSDVKGVWTNQSGSNPYMYYLSGTTADAMSLTSDAQSATQTCAGLLLPQDLVALNTSGAAPTGDYISVNAVINDHATGKQLWPNAATPEQNKTDMGGISVGCLYFPLMTQNVTQWESGVCYNYILTINSPAGLAPIQFGQPAVETYTTVTVTPEEI